MTKQSSLCVTSAHSLLKDDASWSPSSFQTTTRTHSITMSPSTPAPEPSKGASVDQTAQASSPPMERTPDAQPDRTETLLHALDALTDKSGVEGSIHATPVASPVVCTQQPAVATDEPNSKDTKAKKKKLTKKEKAAEAERKDDQASDEQIARGKSTYLSKKQPD